jgi:two-component system NtrC family sensor kinase
VAATARHAGEAETRAIEHQLYDSEKLAALRAIAAGLAHEVGNPLAGIGALLQLAERRTSEPETRDRLRRAHAEIVRVGRLIQELGDFTRADGETATTDVNEVLRAALTLARYAHEGAQVTITVDTDPTLTALVGSRHHLLQACLHLVMNAYDAMPREGGRLSVGSRHEGDTVLLWFEDDGPGVPADMRERIFLPYFTTKPAGAGTGLGLFVARRIVGDFGGRLELTTTAPTGARFEARLPASTHADRSSARRRGH